MIRRKRSEISQESLLIVKGQKKSNKAQTVADLRDLRSIEVPGCIPLVSIGYETTAVIPILACTKP